MEHRTVTVTTFREPILKVMIYRIRGEWWVQRYTHSGMTGTWRMPVTWAFRDEILVRI